MAYEFILQNPSLENYWRGIVLFGQNVASYKFALAEALLELRPQSGQLVRLEELALLQTVEEVLPERRRKVGPLDLGHQSPKVMRASSSLIRCRSTGSSDFAS